MKLFYIIASTFVVWYLLSAAPARTQSNPISDSGIHGIVGCPPVFGNAPAGDPTWPCGRIVESETGKDMGKISCHVLTSGFSIALPPGKYTVHFENEAQTEGVIVKEHKWTDVHAGPKVCPTPPGPVA